MSIRRSARLEPFLWLLVSLFAHAALLSWVEGRMSIEPLGENRTMIGLDIRPSDGLGTDFGTGAKESTFVGSPFLGQRSRAGLVSSTAIGFFPVPE